MSTPPFGDVPTRSQFLNREDFLEAKVEQQRRALKDIQQIVRSGMLSELKVSEIHRMLHNVDLDEPDAGSNGPGL